MKKTIFVALPLLVVALSACKSNLPTIRIAAPYEIQTLDPHVKFTLSHSAVQFNFYEALVSTDAEMNIHPCLAMRWENPDAYTWIFHLRPSVHFHDGKPFTADDVVYSFERLLNSSNLDAASSLVDVTDVKAIDAITVRVHTAAPIPIFLNKLSLVAILAKGSKPEVLATSENGTGPFRLQQWFRGERIEMEPYEHYWGTKPSLSHVTLFLGENPENAYAMLAAGKCDLAQCNAQQLESRIDRSRYSLLIHDSLFVKYLAFDTTRDRAPGCNLATNPFKNKLVRQAIFQAMNRQDLVTRIPVHATPATQLVPELVLGFNPNFKPPAYDPDAAKALLATAGLANGFDLTLHSRKILEDTAKQVQQYLQAIGIRVTLVILPDDQFFKALRAGQASFILSRMGATVGDASDIFESAIHTPDAQRHYGSLNYLAYSNPRVDQLTELAAGTQVTDTRQTQLQNIMELVMEDLPWIPLYVDQDVYALDKRFSWKPRLDSSIFAAEITAGN